MPAGSFLCRLVLLIALLVEVQPQKHVFDCPSDWIEFGSQCYQFVKREETYEQARGACDMHGAALIRIDNRNENSFISQTLQNIDPYKRSWYTGGSQTKAGTNLGDVTSPQTGITFSPQTGDVNKDGEYVWEGDTTPIPSYLQFWLPGVQRDKGGVIVYKYGATGYGWSLVSPGEKLPFICEVSKAEAYRIVHVDRGYDYGILNPDPNDLKTGPYFTTQAHSIVVVGKAQSANIECIAKGNPRPTFKWFRGEDLETEVTSELDKRYTLTNGKLTVLNPEEEQEAGKYRCEAENQFGKILGDPVFISFGHLGDFSNVPDAPVRAKAYSGVAIECSKIAFKPAVKYQWMKGDTKAFIRPELQPYMFISSNGKLYFSEVTRIDQAEYRCIAILAGVSRYTIGTTQPPTRISLPIHLLVSDEAAKSNWGPKIQNDFIAVSPQPPLRGQDVRLECFAYGSSTSAFSYQWTREGLPIPSTVQFSDHNRVMVIENAQLEDSGTYTCTVKRGTSASDSKAIHLNLGALPYFIVPLRNQHVDIGSPLTWRCVARGRPTPTYAWYKNGQQLMSIPGDLLVSGPVLIIHKLQPDRHNGMYQCRAENIHGVAFSGAQIRVLSFSPNFAKAPLPRRTEAVLNGNVTLMCRPEGAPQPLITWHKNGAILPSDSGHFKQLRNGYLVISDLQMSDQGTYMCQATNANGEATTSTQLTIGRTTAITTAPSNTQVIVNQTAFLYCQASYDPVMDLIYTWRFNGRLIDFAADKKNHFLQERTAVKSGLYIRNVERRHDGVYECTAKTTLQEDKRSAVLTVIGPPREPAGVHVDTLTVTSHGVDVRWTAGNNGGRPILFYNIYAVSSYNPKWKEVVKDLPALDAVLQDSTILRTRVEGLNPGTGYRFRITAANDLGSGDPSRPSAFVRTPSAPPAIAPRNVRGGGGKVGDLTIRWEALGLDEVGGTGIGYMVYWRKLETGVVTTGLWKRAEVKGNLDHYVTTVGDENFYLEYEVKVQALNHFGRGPNSTIEVVYSAEALPIGVPMDLFAENFNATAMEVTWTSVPNTRAAVRGRVKGYQINYWPHEHNDPPHFRFIRYVGQIHEGLVIGLEADSLFVFDVQVYNTAGLGPRSGTFLQETANLQPLLYPQEVRVNSHGADSVVVWWRGISTFTGEESLKGYKLYYWTATEDHRSSKVKEVGKDHGVVLEGLEKGILYALRIAGFSAGGEGAKTPTVYFTLGGSVRIDSTLAHTITIRASSSFPVASLPVLIICFILAQYCFGFD